MDYPPGARKWTALAEVLRHAYLRRRSPTEAQLAQSFSHESLLEITSLSIRTAALLPNRRVWLACAHEPTALPRAYIWSEPLFESIGGILAAWLMRQWQRDSRICAIRRRVHQQHNEARRLKWASPGVLADVAQPRNWTRCDRQTGELS